MVFIFSYNIIMNSLLKINLDGIIANIKNYKAKLKSHQKFCAVVKADAYGFGLKKICKAINDEVDYFAVATMEEFVRARAVSDKPIILLAPIYKNITKLAGFNAEFCVSNKFQFEQILKFSERNLDIKFKIHLAVNTGMNRFGFNSLKEIEQLLLKVQKTQNISIYGVFSHFYMGNNAILAEIQSLKLNAVKNLLSQKIDISKIIFHISNTVGFENEKSFDMIRIGLGMFLKYNNQQFSLISKIIEIQNIKAGDTTGYGLGFVANINMNVAVVSIGYADGIMRNLAGKGYVLVAGEFAKILAVCMDSIIIDVTDIDAKLLDEVVLIGKSGDKQIFVCEIASWCDTIEYEILTRISKRVKRVYLGGKSSANHNGQIQSKKTSCGG